MRVGKDHRTDARIGENALIQVAQFPAVPYEVPDVLGVDDEVVRELVLGAEAHLVRSRRLLIRILDAPLDPRRIDVRLRDALEAVLQDHDRRLARGGRGDAHVNELRWVQRELALAAVPVRLLIEESVTTAPHQLRGHRPGKAGARREIGPVRVDEGPVVGAAIARVDDLAGCRIDVRHLVVAIEHRREVLVSYAVVQCERAAQPPGILSIGLPPVAVEIRRVEQRELFGAGETQEEIGVADVRVTPIGERERAVQRAKVDVVDDVTASFDAEFVVVRGAIPGEVFGELKHLGCLVLRTERRPADSRDAADVHGRNAAAELRILRDALDAVLRVLRIAEGQLQRAGGNAVP